MDTARVAVRASCSGVTKESHVPLRPAGHRDDRSLLAVGRQARLDLTFLYLNGRTVLAEAYAEPPFRVGRSFAEGEGVHMILTSSAPGAFGHDQLQQIVRVGCGARVRLTSQSALQVHPSPDGATAHLRSSYHVDDGAHLHCHWHPLIPFTDARIDQRIDVNIAGGGYLYWSDALMSGRHACGERWKFASLAHEIAVSRDGSLEYLERYRIQPNELAVSRPWVADDASHLGTTLMSGRPIEPGVTERVHLELGRLAGVRAAADQLDDRVLLVRLLGVSGAAFHEARRRIRDCGESL
ncbi:MAG TPA: urease accessory protein UreD [Gemmatimonadales bacterium]|nr:urease accessory protein UreD [Gemmatimonadales bacterium]